jgi:hypothetical protein
MCALMPSTEELPGIAETNLNAHLVSLREESTFLYWFGLCLGAVVFAMTPVLTIGIPLPAFWLPRRLLDRHASRIVHSKSYMIRQAVNLVQLNAGLCWGRDDRIRARFNLDAYPADPGTWRTK